MPYASSGVEYSHVNVESERSQNGVTNGSRCHKKRLFVRSSLSSFVRSSLSSFVRSFVRSFVVVVRLFVVAFVCCRCLRSFVRCLRSFVRSCVYLSFPLFAVADFVCCRCLRMWSLPSYVVVLSRVRRRYLPFVRRCCRRYHVIFARCRCRWMSLRRKDAVYVSVTLFGAFGHLC